MNSRERVRLALQHRQPDRPPLDGTFRPEVWQLLRRHFATTDNDHVMDALGFDFRHAAIEPSQAFAASATPAPVDVGVGSGTRNLVHILPGNVFEDERGIRRTVDSTETYYHFVGHPLAASDSPDEYTFPDPDLPERYEHLREQVRRYKSRYMIQTDTGNIFRDAWELRGLEQFMMDMYENPAFVSRLLDLVTEDKLAEVRHMVAEGADVIQMAGDIATEQNMMISPAWWRQEIKPRLARVIAATGRPDVYFCFHSDGAMQSVIPDLIEIGFQIIDPMQPECMDVAAIKRELGAQFTLHSTLSAQHTLPFGSVDDVRAEVRARVGDCGQNGGLIMCPSNIVQEDVPLANLLALYDEARSSAVGSNPTY